MATVLWSGNPTAGGPGRWESCRLGSGTQRPIFSARSELDDDEIVRQVCEPALADSDSDDDSPPAPQPSNADLAQATSMLLSVYSGGQIFAQVQADVIAPMSDTADDVRKWYDIALVMTLIGWRRPARLARHVAGISERKPPDRQKVIEKYLQGLRHYDDHSHGYLKSDEELKFFERSLAAVNERKANSPESNREQRQSAACTPCLDDSGFAREDDATSEYWDNFGIVEESLPGLSLETSVTTQPEEPIITGRRVVSLAHFVNAVRSLDDHSCPKLTGRFALVKERRVGLWSELTFTCSECQEIRKLTTDPVTEPTSLTDKANVGVNDAAVWAFMSIGSGHSQFEEAMAVMEIPAMSKGAFLRREESLGKSSSTTDWQNEVYEKKRLNLQGTKKKGCAATINLKWIVLYPDFQSYLNRPQITLGSCPESETSSEIPLVNQPSPSEVSSQDLGTAVSESDIPFVNETSFCEVPVQPGVTMLPGTAALSVSELHKSITEELEKCSSLLYCCHDVQTLVEARGLLQATFRKLAEFVPQSSGLHIRGSPTKG
ncbi:hypothetical protein HPB51_028142 [Rhipicephalus microplus]|uniref:Mutator-like transposase domain-containing protein n=1 Tax=Rhipicephalus microplus TaxID=6941 RepID=A0A9J6CXT7_RHIMP|nr:hypothetical protein HPB51_028142 [Rhipicephalus microplus]